MNELQYLQSPPQLAGILRRTADLNFATALEPGTGALLRMLAASKPCGHMLELGTGTGIATAWLLSGMDAESTLVTVDADANMQQVAREALGAEPRLKFMVEDTASFIRRLTPASFDLVFASALPAKYDVVDEVLALVKPGGYYVIDDMLPQPGWTDGLAEKVPTLMARLAADERFDLVPMVWASGVVVAVRQPASVPSAAKSSAAKS